MLLVLKQYNEKKDVNKNVNLLIKEDEWTHISYSQKLSEKFIEKYKDRVDWRWISFYQKLSESFIEKHQNYVCWSWILRRQKLSLKFKEKWKHRCV